MEVVDQKSTIQFKLKEKKINKIENRFYYRQNDFATKAINNKLLKLYYFLY